MYISGKFEDSKGITRRRKSQKDRQHNEQSNNDESGNFLPHFNNISLISWRSVLLMEKISSLNNIRNKMFANILYITTDSIKPEKPPLDFHISP
jgi:hypothetical protein